MVKLFEASGYQTATQDYSVSMCGDLQVSGGHCRARIALGKGVQGL